MLTPSNIELLIAKAKRKSQSLIRSFQTPQTPIHIIESKLLVKMSNFNCWYFSFAIDRHCPSYIKSYIRQPIHLAPLNYISRFMAFNNLLIIQKRHCFVSGCVVLCKHYCRLPWCEYIMISRFICQHHKLIKFLSSLCQSAINHLSVNLHQWKYVFTCVCTGCYSHYVL